MRGLNYAPTPKWNNNLKDNKWFRLIIHIRSVKWQNFFNKDNQENNLNNENNLLEKLKIH